MKSLAKKLSLIFVGIVLVTCIVLITFTGLSFNRLERTSEEILYETTLNGYKTEIKSEVQGAVSVVRGFYDLYKNGTITEDAAKNEAKETLRNMRYGDDNSGYFWIDDTNYNLVMHPILSEQEGTNRKDLEDKNGVKIIQEIMKVADNGGYNEFYFTKSDGKTVAPKVAYSLSIPEWNWVITTGVYTDDIQSTLSSSAEIARTKAISRNSVIFMIAIGVVLYVLMFFFCLFICKKLVLVINQVKENLNSIADGDLTGRIDGKILNRKDELGSIVVHTNKAVESFCNSIAASKRTAITVNENSSEISGLADSALEATAQVAEAISNIAGDATTQAGVVSDVVKNIDTMNGNVEKVSNSVDDISHYACELNEASEDMKNKMDAMSKGSMQMSTQIENIYNQIMKTTEAINKMQDVLNVIQDIASQTNLLSLNASIEAARAGDSGRGFSVVASNIRELSENTSKELSNIRDIIGELTSSFEECNASIDTVVDTNKQNTEYTGQVINSFDTVFEDIKNTNEKVSHVTTLTEQISDMMSQIADGIETVQRGAESTAAATEEVTASSEELNALMHNITENCSIMTTEAESMVADLSKFKLEKETKTE